MKWVCEANPVWDIDKQRIIGGAPRGCFNLCSPQLGGTLPYRWWRLETASGEILGYGWLADLQGEAEVSVVATVKGKGYGTKILHNLEKEAKKLGYNRIVAVVQPENPCARDVLNWLFNNGYHAECFPVASQEMLIEAVKRIPISMIKYI